MRLLQRRFIVYQSSKARPAEQAGAAAPSQDPSPVQPAGPLPGALLSYCCTSTTQLSALYLLQHQTGLIQHVKADCQVQLRTS